MSAASWFLGFSTASVVGLWVGAASDDPRWGVASFFVMLPLMLVLTSIGDFLMDIRDELRRR